MLLLSFVSVVASACGSGQPAEAFTGSWQRVVAGEADPSLTLVVARTHDGVTLTFGDPSGSPVQGVARMEEDCLVMDMPPDNGIFDGSTSLQLSLDAGGQLVVDRVLDDGATEPVWIYDRAPQR